MITTPTVSGKPGQAPYVLSLDQHVADRLSQPA